MQCYNVMYDIMCEILKCINSDPWRLWTQTVHLFVSPVPLLSTSSTAGWLVCGCAGVSEQ